MSIEPTTMRISGPGELLAAIPRPLGFHPANSLVLVGLADGKLTVTARLDLIDVEDQAHLASTIAASVRAGCSTVVAAVFLDKVNECLRATRVRLAEDLSEAIDLAGPDLNDVLLVAAARWWSLLCENLDCCPSEGRPMPEAPHPVRSPGHRRRTHRRP